MSHVKREELKPGLYLAAGARELYKVSTLYDHRFTVQQVYPLPPRTTVYSIDYVDLDRFTHPSDSLVRRAEKAHG